MREKPQYDFIPEPPLTTGDIARYCHTNMMQVNRWIKSGALKSFKTPGGQNRISRADFKSFLAENRMPFVAEFFEEKKEKKILIADDDAAIVNAIKKLLESHSNDYKIEVAGDGYEALIKAGDFKPDLLILDIRMPKMDGLEVCRRLRQSSSLSRSMTILTITGHSEAYDRQSVLESGANEYLLKPFDSKTLFEYVERLIG